MFKRRLKVYFDGGCRPNPGPVEVAVVIRGVPHLRDDLGQGTHNDAEWLALIHALELAQASGADAFDLIGDAAMVVEQANGAGACPPALRHHLEAFRAMAARHPPARIHWIGRAQNLAGIALAARHGR